MPIPRLRLEWRVNVVTLGVMLFSMVTGGTMVYAEVIGMKEDMEDLKGKVSRQATEATDQVGRVIRLETRVDFIIDQNKQILAELRAKP